MGLLQKAVETYESHASLIGVYREGTSVLAPISHAVKKADVEITITAQGDFYDANDGCKNESIIIPVSVESAGRSGKAIAPHPLCDQLCYVSSCAPEKYAAYLEKLTNWKESEYSHPKLAPILSYVRKGTILYDLERLGILKLNSKGIPADEKKTKLLVRWRVLGLDDGQSENCWMDETLFSAYQQYYWSIMNKSGFCMVSGENRILAKQHPKGIVSLTANAKLISSNDEKGFTYRGRFIEESQALTVSYEASQKAHNALRWLVDNQGVREIFGGRTFLCWNPQGRTIIKPHVSFRPAPKPIFEPSDYHDDLQKVLNSKKAELKLSDGVVLAAFDAATTGRLSLTYYNELMGHDFLQRLHDWDASCCWPHRNFGIQSPSLRQIVNCAFGTQRTEKGQAKMETDDRVLRQQMQRMIACRVDRTLLGTDVVKSLADRASRPQAYDHYVWEDILFTACAVIRKYRTDRFKEEWNMALEPERKDRSYQFGRLLAVMEKVERDTYGSGESREPNAIRLQSVFCQRPMATAANLEKQLERAYFPRLKPGSRIWYKNLIGQIMGMISEFPGEENKPLDNTYLMGYYLQRAALYAKKNDNETEEDENG